MNTDVTTPLAIRKRGGMSLFKTFVMMLILLLPFQANEVSASNAPEDAYRYTVMLSGMRQMTLDMPVYDEDGYDSWIDKGYVYITCDGKKETLFYYRSWDKSGSHPVAKFYKGVDGTMILKRDRDYSSINVTTSEKEATIPIISGTDYAIIHLVWTIPASYRGKTVTISWNIHKTGNGDNITGEKSRDIGISSSEWQIPNAPELVTPEVMDPVLSYDASHIGTMMLFYNIATNNVKRITGFWKEVNGAMYNDHSIDLNKNVSGFAYLPADQCIKDFYIQATYIDSEDAEQTTESERIDLPTLHQPQNVSAQLQEDGKVVISWKTNHTTWDDISPSDMWEVQRNTSERPEASSSYWRTLDMVSYSPGTEEYTYTDESLLADYKGHDIYYRIRRVGTSSWNWGPNSGYAMAKLPATLMLPYFSSATVQRSGEWDNTHHNVDLQFALGAQFANSTQVKGVRFAPGILGASATTADYELPVDKQGRIVLRNAADWEALVTWVNNKDSQTEHKVIMANDIDLGESHSMLGSGTTFSGVFDGNGHTLTVHYNGIDAEGAAPFTRVGNATIKNLHVAGQISSNKKFAAGLVGTTWSYYTYKLVIENCRVSATVESTVSGDASNGGFVGMTGIPFTITDCLFDGRLLGEESHSTGGYVGAFASGKIGTFTNCLFAPTEIGTKMDDCRTFIREAQPENVTFENCYYITPYDGRKYDSEGRMVLYNNDDWEAFAEKVDHAAASTVDAILAADISITRSVGTTNGFYCGTFYGNGHTLTVNITGEEYAAPFGIIKNATIRDLNVKGTVTGGRHSSGLVGNCVSTGTENHIENCHVSTNVITSDRYAGGIIGHGHSVKNNIINCLFDGSITATEFNTTSYAGAFMGWEDGGTSNNVKNNLESANYYNFNHTGLNYNANNGGSAWGGSNNYHFRNWGEGNNASNLTIDDLVSKLGSANWLVSGNIALPKQSVTQVGQGFSASDLSVAALDSILGNGWQQMGNLVTPVMQTSTEPEHQSIIWDERANVSLNIDKKVENEVRYKEQHTITQEELLNRQVQLDLCTSCVDHDFRLKVEKGESKLPLFSTDTLGFSVKKKEVGELARYEFNNNVQLSEAKADTLQQGVLLKWGITSGVADYYRILRADKMKPEVVDTLVMNYVQTTYLDQTAKVQRNYIYTIEGVTQCEGDHVSTVTVEGCRVPTGTVRGYVRLSNGTGLPNVEVTATPKGNILNAITKTVKTDESGFFEISGLIYQTKGVYDISADGIKGSHDVTFDDDYNLFTDITFYEETYYTFSGYVLYEGSSIPVGGVTFLRDGQPVINSAGQEVTTTPQGAFEISVPGGSHTIQVVKEGHVFENDGFYIDLDKEEGDNRKHNWQKDINNIYLWDKTKVYLQGRVVGGNDQGYLPLGESLSKNNLGEDITIIMELEGDNTSWLVRDQLDPTITTRTNKYCHGLDSKDTTEVIASRRQLKIHPDKNTGEYRIPLYPVKYKVTEIYAKGYSTLFQTGMVSETVNLSDLTNGQTGTYSRIYHTAPTLNVKQRQDEINDTYFGISKYTSRDIAGNNVEIKLWQNGKYTLGYPVFMSGIDVPLWIEACEEYYWNNSPLAEKKDIVRLHGGKVIAKNGLVSTETTDEIELNEAGGASYIFKPRNTTFTLENDMALRKLNFTLEYDSCYYDMQPLEGYIMAATEVPQGRRIVAGENAHLVDILRDPPGSGSSAYIEEGTKLSYSYTADIKAVVGVSLDLGLGKGNDYFMGIWFGEGHGDVAGSINSTTNYGSVTLNAVVGYYNDWTYNYEITTNERIETSSETNGKASNIGANADLYIGFADNIIVADGIAVYPVNSKTLSYLTPREGNTVKVNGYDFDVKGTVKILARGYDEGEGDSIYLIRNEVMKVSSSPKASFIYSQQHILNDIIPTLLRSRAALLKPTMDAAEAQKLANDTKETVYVSNVEIDDPKFGYDYHVYYPAGGKDTNTNEVQKLNNRIAQWAGFIAANEKEKMEAKTLMKRYDFDGMASISYSESMSADRTEHRYIQIPGITLSGDGATPASGQKDAQPHYTDSGGDDPQMNGVEFIAGGLFVQLKIMPVAQFDFNYNNGQEENRTKGTGFTLKCSPRSNLSVAVYYTENLSEDSIAALDKLGSIGKYYKFTKETMENIYSPTLGPDNQLSWLTNDKRTRYRNFVFRTEGGATESPWEDERRTIFHNAGQNILDQKTLQIDKLRIWADKQSVSNVPMGEPARFTIYMTNEGEMPASVTKALKIFADDAMNPKGAHIVVNGVPITGSGFDIWLEPNTIMEKVVEIYANEEYDYEDIGLCIINENDIEHVETVTLSAHFVPSAGKINISSPGDKWVMNTDSYYDSDKQAYSMPIHIDGFDVNFRNFDHIELQYKLSTQGEKEWVNVCSFYRNNEEGEKLMALASGERKLMEHDGYIDVDFYGEVDPIEQRYDIRAVAYCRHGNGYLTSSSNVLSGIKDTRRPVPFGTPQPANGILGIGDDIKIAFSEPIAGNYLSPINNFQVLGLTNSSNISLSTALHFTGQSMAISQAARNLTAKDFTLDVMINPEKTDKEMVVLSHGNHEHSMSLGLTADHHLMATFEGYTMMSDSIVKFDGLHQVAYVVDNLGEKSTKVTFYDGNKKIGEGEFPDMYYGKGNLCIGYNPLHYADNYNFVGDMLEMRLWNKAMSKSELGNYAQKRLTGYELGLLDNYPMNEGKGIYTYDKAVGGNDVFLYGTTWKVPDGISMKLDGKKGIKLDPKLFKREEYQDYTLMFWFRTNDDAGTLIANGPAKDEDDYKDHFNIGLSLGKLYFRSGGQQIDTDEFYADGSWHHVAVTVNRSRNVGNLYVDQSLKQTFPVDTLGGINGNNLALGATYTDAHTPTNLLEGNIDEVSIYEMVLPENMLKNYSNLTPYGSEMGLLAYLPFSRSELQSDNSQRLMPTGISLKKYKDNHGNIVESRRDTIISQDVITANADRTNYAPMKNIGNLENIKFSYVADGKDLLINLDVPDYQIEKNNIFLTVKEVADLQGNLMASPIVMDLYAYRNPLRWTVKRKSVEAMYGDGATVDLTIENLSGKSQSYTLEGLPMWITASQTSGVIGALSEQQVTLTISPYINIGTFDEIITIVGENGMTEPLPLTIRIRGEEPNWVVSNEMRDGNLMMHIVAQVMVNGEIAHNPEDILTVFGPGHEVMGTTHIDVDNTANANEARAYLNVYYKTKTREPIPLHFEFYDSETGRISVLKPQGTWVGEVWKEADTIYFNPDTIIGSSMMPLILEETYEYVQPLKLQKGWNWLSFYVEPRESTISDLLEGAAVWEVGDGLEAINARGKAFLFTYKAKPNPDDENSELYYWNKGDTRITLDPCLMYRFYVQNEKTAYLSGHEVSYAITVRKGWNRIGYMSSLNLPIATALAEYTDEASDGDIIKSQSEFAVLNIDNQGNRYWKGSLKYLRSGEGYMINHKGASEITFSYPYYNNSRYNSGLQGSKQTPPLYCNNTGSSMNIIAQVEGVELEEGDRLVAYMGAETVGIAEAGDDGLFFLTIGQGDTERVNFTIEHDGEIVATTAHSMPYVDNNLSGSLDKPTVINFTESDGIDGEGWYTVSGIKLSGKPNRKGVFIHNGQKVTIK